MAAAGAVVDKKAPSPVAAYSVNNPEESVDFGNSSAGPNASLKRNGKLQQLQLAGTLYKMGRRFKGWHERYYELNGTELQCYKDSAKHALSGSIDLLTCTRVGISRPSSYGFTFEIQAPERMHVFAAKSSEEREQWRKTIADIISGSKRPKDHVAGDGDREIVAASADAKEQPERKDTTQPERKDTAQPTPNLSAVESLRELLKSLPETTQPLEHSDLPEGEEEWRKQPTAIEQLRQYLVTCP